MPPAPGMARVLRASHNVSKESPEPGFPRSEAIKWLSLSEERATQLSVCLLSLFKRHNHSAGQIMSVVDEKRAVKHK